MRVPMRFRLGGDVLMAKYELEKVGRHEGGLLLPMSCRTRGVGPKDQWRATALRDRAGRVTSSELLGGGERHKRSGGVG
jgi:hypothetical protein